MRTTRVGLILLAAVAAIFSLGVVAGRVSVPQQPAAAPATTQPPDQAGAAPGQAAPDQTATEQAPATQAPATQPEAAQEPSQAGAEDPGPTSVQDGVPVGYAHTREGAVAAATAYIRVMSSPVILDERRRRAAVTALADPATLQQQLQNYDRSAPAIAQALRLPASGGTGGIPVLLQTIPARTHVDRYDADTATVSIWQTSLGGTTNGVPVMQRWGTTTVDLRWVDGDWKQVAVRSAAGPVPLADDAQPTAASELIGTVNDYEEYEYAPGP